MKYVALIRGIGPVNPNMQGAKLKEFFEGLGFEKVKPVISSENIIFESNKANIIALEEKIEKELPKKLGFSKNTIIRSEEQLKQFISKKSFCWSSRRKTKLLIGKLFQRRERRIGDCSKYRCGENNRIYVKTGKRTWQRNYIQNLENSPPYIKSNRKLDIINLI